MWTWGCLSSGLKGGWVYGWQLAYPLPWVSLLWLQRLPPAGTDLWVTPNFTGLSCRSCPKTRSLWASTYYCCVGDKTSDSLIDGFADLTIPCESRVPEPGLHLWPAAREAESPWDGTGSPGRGAKSSSLWAATWFLLIPKASTLAERKCFLLEKSCPSLKISRELALAPRWQGRDHPVSCFCILTDKVAC